MAQNNDGPGKRLKREQAKNNILYVNRPDDPRLRAYEDSASTFNNLNKVYKKFGQLNENQFSDISEVQNAMREIKSKHPTNSNLLSFAPVLSSPIVKKFNLDGFPFNIRKDASATAPKRKVVYRPEPRPTPVEPIQPREAPLPKLSSEIEFVAPVRRIPETTNVGEHMGVFLRYPSQDVVSRVKRFVSGEPNLAYWVDKNGVKRYGAWGENTEQNVKDMEALKYDLNPNVPEEAAQLEKIDMLRKLRPGDRKQAMQAIYNMNYQIPEEGGELNSVHLLRKMKPKDRKMFIETLRRAQE